MIAMQYGFTLPADYDMAIIDRRIAERGHLTDGFPGLAFKAYLSSRPEAGSAYGPDKAYAPFYLWHGSEGLNDFVCGPGFAALSRDFGRPAIRTWIPWAAETTPEIRGAAVASVVESAIAVGADLAALRDGAQAKARAAIADGARASLIAFDPTGWTIVRFALADRPPDGAPAPGETRHIYRVGHVSLGPQRGEARNPVIL